MGDGDGGVGLYDCFGDGGVVLVDCVGDGVVLVVCGKKVVIFVWVIVLVEC